MLQGDGYIVVIYTCNEANADIRFKIRGPVYRYDFIPRDGGEDLYVRSEIDVLITHSAS